MKVNLTPAQKATEDLMLDQCAITRDVQLTADDTWDPVTGNYTAPISDEDTLYSGKCTVAPIAVTQISDQGGGEVQNTDYWVTIPLGSGAELQPDDMVVVTAVHPKGDPNLLSKLFTIREELHGTFAVSRRLRCVRYAPVP